MPGDAPLTFWASFNDPQIVEDNLIAFGLPKVSGVKAKARLAIAAAAIAAADTNRSVSYSRNKNFYTDLKRYQGKAFTYAHVTQIVDEFEANDLLEEVRASPGSHLKHLPNQSKFRATPKLLEFCKDQMFSFNELEIIHLRGLDKRLCGYTDTPETNAMRSELAAVNAELAKVEVRLTTPNLHYEGAYLVVDGTYILPGTPRLVRMFCRGRFDRGGRLYGWWQNLPKHIRQAMLLNGEPVCEPDFACIHGNLLYAEASLDMDGDPYLIEGYPREAGKLAFNVAVNAGSAQSAIGAIQHDLGISRSVAASLLRAVKKRHSGLKGVFGTDAGVRLMRQDSDIILHSLKELQQAGIPALPIHDSMIAPERYQDKVKECMLESYKKFNNGRSIIIR